MTDKLTKRELVNKIAEKAGIAKSTADAALQALIEEITEALKRGEKVSLVGFGTFEVTNRKARKGRNPKSGANIDIPATRVPRFKAGKSLKEDVK